MTISSYRNSTPMPAGYIVRERVRKRRVQTPQFLERDQLIAILGATPSEINKRLQVLRAIADDSDLRAAEFNKAFVLEQYFGYLRRNPDEAPDNNFDGYNFWLTKLNQFNGNFVNADMVKAFLVSGEYRRRFAP